MDPNEALRGLRRMVSDAEGVDRTDALEYVGDFATMFAALDDWLSRGGYPPEVWREGPPHFGDDPDPREEHHYTRREIVNGTGWAPGQTFTADPLGGPVPGADGSVLPEDALGGAASEAAGTVLTSCPLAPIPHTIHRVRMTATGGYEAVPE